MFPFVVKLVVQIGLLAKEENVTKIAIWLIKAFPILINFTLLSPVNCSLRFNEFNLNCFALNSNLIVDIPSNKHIILSSRITGVVVVVG